MKSQRRFVVEIKSSRRRPKTQAPSIWGDTDFKALAREVEVQAPHIFEELKAPENIVDAPAPTSSDGDQPPAVISTDKPADAVQSVPVARTPPISRKRAATKQSLPSSVRISPPPSETAAAPLMSFGALMELDDLNRHLRARLREQLTSEHAELVRMLERMNLRSKQAG